MDRPEATRSAWARGWLCAVALSAIVLAGCGSISASPTGAAKAASPKASSSPTPSASPSPSAGSGAAATQAALCQHTATVTGLEILRNHLMRVPQLQVALPSQITVTAANARAAARALCALPLLPRGVFHCPSLTIGTTYLLRFTADGRELAPVSIEATGCELVSGVGAARWAAKSPGFWPALAKAANLSPPGRSAFIGGGSPSCEPTSGRPDQANDCPAQMTPDSGGVS